MSTRQKHWTLGIMVCALSLAAAALPWVGTPYAYAGDPKAIYACSACGFQQADKGACPKCKTDLAKYEVTYECAACGMAQTKPGNCSMCGTELKEKKTPA